MFAKGIAPKGWLETSRAGSGRDGWWALGRTCTILNGDFPSFSFILANFLGIATSVDMGWLTRMF